MSYDYAFLPMTIEWSYADRLEYTDKTTVQVLATYNGEQVAEALAEKKTLQNPHWGMEQKTIRIVAPEQYAGSYDLYPSFKIDFVAVKRKIH